MPTSFLVLGWLPTASFPPVFDVVALASGVAILRFRLLSSFDLSCVSSLSVSLVRSVVGVILTLDGFGSSLVRGPPCFGLLAGGAPLVVVAVSAGFGFDGFVAAVLACPVGDLFVGCAVGFVFFLL